MARYEHEFMGIPADLPEGHGMDPNFRGGYRGMRMRGDSVQAAYGWHRWTHSEDFGGSGGFFGHVDRPRRQDRSYARDYTDNRLPPGMQDEIRGGGVRDLRRDRETLRDFNANSPTLHDPMRYAVDYTPYGRQRSPFGNRRPGRTYDYANRGLSSGGYSEGWAWGPMRGAR